jgi:type IV pilus assembly protein PilP
MMRRSVKRLSCLLLLLSLAAFAGCGKESPPLKTAPAVQKPQPASQVSVKPQEEKKQEAEVYEYDPKGRRDPFTSLIAIAKEKQQHKKSANPMENFDVNEIRLTAIVWDKSHYYALITLPDNKSYTITEGMTLGLYGGKVEKITKDSVLVREQIRDYRGQLNTKDTILRLRKEGEE